MTEREWLASDNPQAMLDWFCYRVLDVQGSRKKGCSDRKLRLFACAVVRLLGRNSLHPEIVAVVEACEQVADGGLYQWSRGQKGLDDARRSIDAVWGWTWAATCGDIARGLEDAIIQMQGNSGSFYRQDEVAALMRDIVGNPFRSAAPRQRCGPCGIPCGPPTPGYSCVKCGASRDETHCPWFTPDVLSLAQAVYDGRDKECPYCKDATFTTGDYGGPMMGGLEPQTSRAKKYLRGMCQCKGTYLVPNSDGTLNPDRLAVLADVLEENGCTDDGILRHLRGEETCYECLGSKQAISRPRHLRGLGCSTCRQTGWRPLRGPHVRGCWAVDLVLGKE